MKIFSRHSSFGPARRGFSLIEILVAVALLVVIMLGLLAMFYQTQRAFRQGVTQANVLEAGRAAMQLITRELQGLTPSRVGETQNLVARNDRNGSALLTQPLPVGEIRTNLLQDITFLVRENDEWRAIAYRIENADQGVGQLKRMTASITPDTFNPGPEIFTLSDTVVNLGPATNTFHPVIDGVVHLRLRAFDTNGFPIIGGSTNGVQNFGLYNYIFEDGAVPAYVDVELGILEPRALSQFRARTTVPAKAAAYLEQHADKVHLFKQRLAIRNTQ